MEDKTIERAASWANDAATRGKAIDSVVLRGDLSGLGPGDRARFYVQMCEGLGLNPTSQPFAFLRLNGKEILYATRGATDQLAAMHRVTREIIDGPKVIDLGGTKLVYAVCKASMPNGRFETSVATVPLIDPVNVLMKAETKAKRRATLSILGLGLLDEVEIESIPARSQEPGGGIDLSRANDPVEVATIDQPTGEVAHPLAAFYARLPEIELPSEAVAVWLTFRSVLHQADGADREAAWKAICARTEEVGRMKSGKTWLKKALAEEDGKRSAPAREPGDEGPDDEPTPPAGGDRTRRSNTAANGSAVATSAASGPVGLVEPWMESETAMRGYLSQRSAWMALENALRKHSRVTPTALRGTWLQLAAWRLQALAIGEGQEIPLDGDHGCRAIVAKWAAEGPRSSSQQLRKVA
jgi:hypothetical protein